MFICRITSNTHKAKHAILNDEEPVTLRQPPSPHPPIRFLHVIIEHVKFYEKNLLQTFNITTVRLALEMLPLTYILKR